MFKLLFLGNQEFDFFLYGLNVKYYTCIKILDTKVISNPCVKMLIVQTFQKPLKLYLFISKPRVNFICNNQLDFFHQRLNQKIRSLLNTRLVKVIVCDAWFRFLMVRRFQNMTLLLIDDEKQTFPFSITPNLFSISKVPFNNFYRR